MDSFRKYKDSLKGSRVQAHIIEGFTHPQEFDEIDQVLPVVLAFMSAPTADVPSHAARSL